MDSYSCINLGMEMVVVSGGDVRIIRVVFVSFVRLMSSILLLEREGKRDVGQGIWYGNRCKSEYSKLNSSAPVSC